jgi:hypothetical protein
MRTDRLRNIGQFAPRLRHHVAGRRARHLHSLGSGLPVHARPKPNGKRADFRSVVRQQNARRCVSPFGDFSRASLSTGSDLFHGGPARYICIEYLLRRSRSGGYDSRHDPVQPLIVVDPVFRDRPTVWHGPAIRGGRRARVGATALVERDRGLARAAVCQSCWAGQLLPDGGARSAGRWLIRRGRRL